jgi:hypothetical protein
MVNIDMSTTGAAMNMLATIPQGSVSLSLPSDIDYDAWKEIGKGLSFHQRNNTWLLGDWYRHGEQHFAEQLKLDIGDITDDVKTLRSAAKVSGEFPAELRDASLSFTHYKHLSALPHGEARRALEQSAKETGATAKSLRLDVMAARIELGQGDFVEDDHVYTEHLALQRLWNNSCRDAREYFLPAAIEANMGPISA